MSKIMTVQEAFAAATTYQAQSESQIDIVQELYKGRVQDAGRTSLKVGIEVGTHFAGVRKADVDLKLTSNLRDIWRFAGSGVIQDYLKTQGDLWKAVAYAWKGAEVIKDIARGGGHPYLIIYEIGMLVNDIALDVQKSVYAEQKREMEAKIDFVTMAYVECEQMLLRKIDSLTKESQSVCDKSVQKWLRRDSGSFCEQLINSLITPGDRGRAGSGYDLVHGLVVGALKHDLAYIYGLSASLYCAGLAAGILQQPVIRRL